MSHYDGAFSIEVVQRGWKRKDVSMSALLPIIVSFSILKVTHTVLWQQSIMISVSFISVLWVATKNMTKLTQQLFKVET